MPLLPEKQENEALHKIRHSLAHVMAQAVQELYPGTRLGFGPAIEDGFYYDFLFPEPISDGDLKGVQKRMQKIIKSGQIFEREDLPVEEAMTKLEGMQEPHKVEYARELVEKRGIESLSFYTNGPFLDMCEGPHVENTKELPVTGFKLHSVAGAYWRGDEKNVMMTRIYAYAFETKEKLKEYIAAVELAQKRDHRKLGQALDLYVIDDRVGKGLPLWLPKGTTLRKELEKLAAEYEFEAGYVEVSTPHITKRGLFETSGHIPLYMEGMYPPMTLNEEGKDNTDGPVEEYYLKPMNCPHHHMIFAARKRSYRDLPLRLTEYGTVYRYERGGALQGLARVRGMTMNDAHLYVTQEQLLEEFKAVLDLHDRYYALFGLTDYTLRLSQWDPDDPKRAGKYVDDPENWAWSEGVIEQALEESGLYYRKVRGEAAFYGPKVDYQFRTVTGREFSLSTNQLDFAVPKRFGLTYTDRDGQEKTPICLHRAPLSTHERFIAFLIEHYGGAFPTWLSPDQVRIVPISEAQLDYARKLEGILRKDRVRTFVDDSSNTLGKKIRLAATSKTPIVLVVGGDELENTTVTVRRYGIREQRTMDLDAFLTVLRDEIRERRHVTTLD
jgi:threonyl-tRNA synthetase